MKNNDMKARHIEPDGKDPRSFTESILVVDDERDITIAIVMALQELNIPILEASDGDKAQELFDENGHPAIVVLDMMLPKRSGFLVLETIKRECNRVSDALPIVIMITGNLGPRHKIYAERLGTFEYLTKPFRMAKLMETVENALEIVRRRI